MVPNGNSPLLSLANELVLNIATFLPPDDLLIFSLTCKRISCLIAKALEIQKQYHSSYRLIHDRQPLTIPFLLRTVIPNEKAAWHLRVFESWGIRPRWKEWTSWKFRYGITGVHSDQPTMEEMKNWPEQYEDHSDMDESFFNVEEYKMFEKVMQEVYCFNVSETEYWIAKMKAGIAMKSVYAH
jgi:hypothetical protein